MNNVRKQKKAVKQNKLLVDFDKNMIKETILETYEEIKKERSLHTPSEFLKLPLSLIFGAFKITLVFFALGFLMVPFLMIYTKGLNYISYEKYSAEVLCIILS